MPSPDPSVLQIAGAKADSKYISLATVKFIAGLCTQRSPFAAIDTRYGTRFLGGKPDALIAGSNCEISNKLTLVRRPGTIAYGAASIPPPQFFYSWEQVVPSNLTLMVDTASAIYNYSTTYAGKYLNKDQNSSQTSFYALVNTLYFGDGVDLYKVIGPNLLKNSTITRDSPWSPGPGVESQSTGPTDPFGGSNSIQIVWGAADPDAYVKQTVTPNYMPVGSNTFTFSIYLKILGGAQSLTLYIMGGSGAVRGSATFALTSDWARYQVTAVMDPDDTSIIVSFGNPTSYGIGNKVANCYAQLEVGGPASPAQITTTLPQGVYLWGIVAPTNAPTLSFSQIGNRWQSTHTYALYATIVDSNGNSQVVTAGGGGMSGGSEPTWNQTQGGTTTDGALTWTNNGLVPVTAQIGYQYYYAYMCSLTGALSPVSPISVNTGVIIGQQVVVRGAYSLDPQVDTVVVFRNTDGGPFFYQAVTLPNNTSGGTWSYADIYGDSTLNTSLYAPLSLINSPPPAGLTNLAFFAGRLWGSVGSLLYYASGPDDAAQLNIVFNGVSAESWAPLNVIPFDYPIVRSVAITAGLLVFTTNDIWIVTGQDLNSFAAFRVLANHGLRSYNALDVDGSSIYMYTSDRQFLQISPTSTGSLEIGFSIGDTLEDTFDPTEVYIARHVSGSRDNAVFIADGSTGWYRLNPNQVGASLSGEQTPLFSPFATITNGCGALASIETSPGVHKLLIGGTGTGPVLVRDLGTFTDFMNFSAPTEPYTWTATVGSVVLANSGELAEAESITVDMNATGNACASVEVLFDEINDGMVAFTNVPSPVNDPPQLGTSKSVLSERYYISPSGVPPLCKHMQIKLNGGATPTADEMLALTVRGVLVPEQS